MENAAKALMIAGGILLAIITITLLVYMMTAASSMAEAQDAKNLAEEIAAFNREYESYNKKIMYGTDVITVVNKAINHNGKIGAKVEDSYYINIIIEIKEEDFKTTGQVVDTSDPDATNNKKNMTDDEIVSIGKGVTTVFKKGDTIELGRWINTTTLEMHKDIVEFFSQDKEDYIIKGTGTNSNKVYYIYSALTNFKRAIFKCEHVIYNPDTGRIQEMKFVQTKKATYD